jgi:hypothetical protein
LSVARDTLLVAAACVVASDTRKYATKASDKSAENMSKNFSPAARVIRFAAVQRELMK